RRLGGVARIDFSMLEAMLWTMAEPLLAAQLRAPPLPAGNRSARHAPHGAYRCTGDDQWISIAVTDDAEWRRLCPGVPALAPPAGAAALSPLCPFGSAYLAERLPRSATRLGWADRGARVFSSGGALTVARCQRRVGVLPSVFAVNQGRGLGAGCAVVRVRRLF